MKPAGHARGLLILSAAFAALATSCSWLQGLVGQRAPPRERPVEEVRGLLGAEAPAAEPPITTSVSTTAQVPEGLAATREVLYAVGRSPAAGGPTAHDRALQDAEERLARGLAGVLRDALTAFGYPLDRPGTREAMETDVIRRSRRAARRVLSWEDAATGEARVRLELRTVDFRDLLLERGGEVFEADLADRGARRSARRRLERQLEAWRAGLPAR